MVRNALGTCLLAVSGLVPAAEALAASAVGDTIPPTIASAHVLYDPDDPEETAILEFVFSEPVDWFHAVLFSNYIDSNTGETAYQGFWYPPDRTQVLFPSGFYGYGTCEQVRIINVVDLAGNEIVDDGVGNAFTFHLQQVLFRAQMRDHMKVHDVSPHSFAIEGDSYPLTMAPMCDVPLADADGDSIWTQLVFFDVPCSSAVGGPATKDVEFLFSHDCTELEPIGNRLLELDLAAHPDGRDTLDLDWADVIMTGTDPFPSRSFSLESVFPNPTARATTVAFSLSDRSRVRLDVVDVRGRVVRHLLHQERLPGPHRVSWDGRTDRGRPAPAGVYFVRFDADGRTASRRVVVAR